MKRISNQDWHTLQRLLPLLESMRVPDLRASNVIRRCRIILRKWQKRTEDERASEKTRE